MFYGEAGDLSLASKLGRSRAGRKRDDETDAEYEARVREAMPKANRVPPVMSDAVTQREQDARQGKKRARS